MDIPYLTFHTVLRVFYSAQKPDFRPFDARVSRNLSASECGDECFLVDQFHRGLQRDQVGNWR